MTTIYRKSEKSNYNEMFAVVLFCRRRCVTNHVQKAINMQLKPSVTLKIKKDQISYTYRNYSLL